MATESGFTGTTENSYSIGDGTDSDKYLYANLDTDYDPYLVYNQTGQIWEFSNDGYISVAFGSGSGDGYSEILYKDQTPVFYTIDAPSPYGDGYSVLCDGYFFFEKDVAEAILAVEPSSDHDGIIFKITGQSDYTYTYNGGGILLESGDGYLAGNIILKPGDSSVGNIILNGSEATDMNDAEGCLFVGEMTAVPTGNPTAGGYLFVEGGILKWQGSSGTITLIAPA